MDRHARLSGKYHYDAAIEIKNIASFAGHMWATGTFSDLDGVKQRVRDFFEVSWVRVKYVPSGFVIPESHIYLAPFFKELSYQHQAEWRVILRPLRPVHNFQLFVSLPEMYEHVRLLRTPQTVSAKVLTEDHRERMENILRICDENTANTCMETQNEIWRNLAIMYLAAKSRGFLRVEIDSLINTYVLFFETRDHLFLPLPLGIAKRLAQDFFEFLQAKTPE